MVPIPVLFLPLGHLTSLAPPATPPDLRLSVNYLSPTQIFRVLPSLGFLYLSLFSFSLLLLLCHRSSVCLHVAPLTSLFLSSSSHPDGSPPKPLGTAEDSGTN